MSLDMHKIKVSFDKRSVPLSASLTPGSWRRMSKARQTITSSQHLILHALNLLRHAIFIYFRLHFRLNFYSF